MQRWLLPVAGLTVLAACAHPEPPDTLQPTLKSYYAAIATEEAGACPDPEISAITKRKIIRAAGDTTVLRVRYSYFDPSVEEATDWPRVLIGERPCTGFAERDFTLVRGPTGFNVTEMSGERRNQE